MPRTGLGALDLDDGQLMESHGRSRPGCVLASKFGVRSAMPGYIGKVRADRARSCTETILIVLRAPRGGWAPSTAAPLPGPHPRAVAL